MNPEEILASRDILEKLDTICRRQFSGENEQFELDQLLGQKKVNDTKVKKQFQKLEKARKNLANERLEFVIGVRNILGADRFQQLKSNYKSWQ